MNTAALLLELMVLWTQRTQQAQLLLQRAQAEGRTVTESELNDLVSGDDSAKADLELAIAAKVQRESSGG